MSDYVVYMFSTLTAKLKVLAMTAVEEEMKSGFFAT